MNEKTAKLLRKYSKAMPETNLNDLKRRWNAMDQFERRDFRLQMQSEIEAAGPIVEAEADAGAESKEEA